MNSETNAIFLFQSFSLSCEIHIVACSLPRYREKLALDSKLKEKEKRLFHSVKFSVLTPDVHTTINPRSSIIINGLSSAIFSVKYRKLIFCEKYRQILAMAQEKNSIQMLQSAGVHFQRTIATSSFYWMRQLLNGHRRFDNDISRPRLDSTSCGCVPIIVTRVQQALYIHSICKLNSKSILLH